METRLITGVQPHRRLAVVNTSTLLAFPVQATALEFGEEELVITVELAGAEVRFRSIDGKPLEGTPKHLMLLNLSE